MDGHGFKCYRIVDDTIVKCECGWVTASMVPGVAIAVALEHLQEVELDVPVGSA